MLQAKHISIFIDCTPAKVYEFASNPKNLSLWAAGLAQSEVKEEGDVWVAKAPFGDVKIKFAPNNIFGIMDHEVQIESGETFLNPMRVVPNGDASELIFTLFRQASASDQEYADDVQAIEKDLQTLKAILETKPD